MKNFKNITSNRQQVNYADGSCVDIEPFKTDKVDTKRVHVAEMQRVGKFLVELPRNDNQEFKKENKKKKASQTDPKTPKSDEKNSGGKE